MPAIELRFLPGDRVSIPDWMRAGIVRCVMLDAQNRLRYMVHGDARPGEQVGPFAWLAAEDLVPLVIAGREVVP
jgi:hypothetical protein